MKYLWVLLFSFVCIISRGYADPPICGKGHCLAVVDAGSTGSRLHIYSYLLDKTSTPSQIKEIASQKIIPGLSAINLNSESINRYLERLFPEQNGSTIPVYFYATGGMRFLSKKNQSAYYQYIQQWFLQHSEWQLVEAKTISGQEEALYDWLAVNYQLDTLDSTQKSPVGVVDIGGASVQIAFPVVESQKINPEDKVEINLYGRELILFVHSFLGLGQTEMTHQFMNTLTCYPKDYDMPDGRKGTGEAQDCHIELASLVNQVHGVHDLIHPVLGSNEVNQWYVIGGLAYLLEDEIFHFEKHQFTNKALIQEVNNRVCHQLWGNLQARYPSHDDSLDHFCLYASYYYALMVDGYGFNSTQNINTLSTHDLSNWTVGVVLNH